MRQHALVIGLLLAAVGCEPDLPQASQITHMRVLGASTTVMGDSTRSSPKPGETAQLTWHMAYPDPRVDDSELRSIFFVCTAPKTFTGTPICQELLDIAAGGSIAAILSDARGQDAPDCDAHPDRVYQLGPFRIVCSAGTPRFDVAIPKDNKAHAKLVRGIICRNGTPLLDEKDPTGMSCKPRDGAREADVEAIAVTGTVPIQNSDKDRNEIPSIDALAFGFHDPPLLWEELSPSESDALSDEICLAEAKAKHVMHTEGNQELITLTYDADKREVREGVVESLEISGYSTFGKLSRRFTVFSAKSEVPLRSTFRWDLKPEERDAVLGKSKRVRFFFTVMDHRGGFAVTARDLCINR